MRLRAMIQRRTKTDKLDAQLLANLLRINQIPLAYIPPERYQQLRDLTRCRARLGRQLAEVKIQLRALLTRQNRESPYSGLTSRVHQSGGHCYQGSITRQGSPFERGGFHGIVGVRRFIAAFRGRTEITPQRQPTARKAAINRRTPKGIHPKTPRRRGWVYIGGPPCHNNCCETCR